MLRHRFPFKSIMNYIMRQLKGAANMKKQLSALFAMLMLTLFLCPFVSAEDKYNDITLCYSLTCEGEHTKYVKQGDILTVEYHLLNATNGNDFPLAAVFNEIFFDNQFFEYMGKDKVVKGTYTDSSALRESSSGKNWMFFNSSHLNGQAYKNGQFIGSFQLKVKKSSGQSTIKSDSTRALDLNGCIYRSNAEDLTVIIANAPETLYTVTYINGKNESKSKLPAGSMTLAAAPDGEPGYTFLGWENQTDGKLYVPGSAFTLTENTTFTAKWKAPVQKYVLTFQTNGGTTIGTNNKIVAEDGTALALSDYTTTKTGSRFIGWYSDEALTKPVTAITMDENKTVYAKWETLITSCTLSFETNGGSTLAPVTKEKDTVISLSAYVTEKSGYTFKGWYAEPALTKKLTSITLDSDKTVYAKWAKNTSTGGGTGSITRYTITFETNGGSSLDPVIKVRNTTVELSKYITKKDGYSFDGWHTDKELTNKVTEIKATANMTLYAKWAEGDTGYKDAPNYKPDIFASEHYAYLVGREDGYVWPEANLTRAEAAEMFYRLLNSEVRTEAYTTGNSFRDVKEDDWFNESVSTLANLEVLIGRSEGVFEPDAEITRAELTTIIARLSEASYVGNDCFDDIAGHWAQNYINIAASIGWVNGDENGKFRPDDSITRAEVVTMINRALNRLPEMPADLIENMLTPPDNANTNAWYYMAIQEAVNSHTFEKKADGVHEVWTGLTENPDWLHRND